MQGGVSRFPGHGGRADRRRESARSAHGSVGRRGRRGWDGGFFSFSLSKTTARVYLPAECARSARFEQSPAAESERSDQECECQSCDQPVGPAAAEALARRLECGLVRRHGSAGHVWTGQTTARWNPGIYTPLVMESFEGDVKQLRHYAALFGWEQRDAIGQFVSN